MKKIASAPVSTPISDKANLNLPWQTWLREAGEILVSATKQQNNDGTTFTQIGQICFFSISGHISSGIVKLPYKAAVNKKIAVFVGSAIVPVYVNLGAGASQITVPTTDSISVSDWYVCEISQ
jgi:hypothetical protein